VSGYGYYSGFSLAFTRLQPISLPGLFKAPVSEYPFFCWFSFQKILWQNYRAKWFSTPFNRRSGCPEAACTFRYSACPPVRSSYDFLPAISNSIIILNLTIVSFECKHLSRFHFSSFEVGTIHLRIFPCGCFSTLDNLFPFCPWTPHGSPQGLHPFMKPR